LPWVHDAVVEPARAAAPAPAPARALALASGAPDALAAAAARAAAVKPTTATDTGDAAGWSAGATRCASAHVIGDKAADRPWPSRGGVDGQVEMAGLLAIPSPPDGASPAGKLHSNGGNNDDSSPPLEGLQLFIPVRPSFFGRSLPPSCKC
jgi:hypothetical protein